MKQLFYDLGLDYSNKYVGLRSKYLLQFYREIDKEIDEKLTQGIEVNQLMIPVAFEYNLGRKWVDVITTGLATRRLVISKHFKEILIENNVTGWKTYDVKIFDKKHNVVDGYFGLSITGRAKGPVFHKDSIQQSRAVPVGPLFDEYVGFDIVEDSWDGSDIFLLETKDGSILGYNILSERLYKILVDAGVDKNGLNLLKISDCKIHGSNIDNDKNWII